MAWKLYEGNCLDIMPSLPDKSVDLIILDPPYNIGKDTWDKFPSHTEYLKFIYDTIKECERLLKDKGSLYIYQNQFDSICDFQYFLKNKTELIFKQLIVWDKWHNDFEKGNNLQGAFYKIVHNPSLRNYPKMCEYLLYYTFQEDSGLDIIKLDLNNFRELRDYFKEFQNALKLTLPQINKILGHRRAEHGFYWKSTQWDLPIEEVYTQLLSLPLQDKSFIPRQYEELRNEYEDLRLEYESLRYTFNQYNNETSIWNYPIPNKSEREGHPTQKPISLCENIIKHSSNSDDTVLVPFAGSGSEMVASTNLNRNVIGIELDPIYCSNIRERLNEQIVQTRLSLEAK